MKKVILPLLKDLYDYDSYQAVLASLIPTSKYGLTFTTAVFSTFLATINDVTGMSQEVFLGFAAIMMLELFTGVYTAVIVKKQSFSSSRLFRFLFKMAIYVTLIAATFNMSKSEMTIVSATFSWLSQFIVVQITIENFFSVLENVAVTMGKEKHDWPTMLRDKLNDFIFKTPAGYHSKKDRDENRRRFR